MKVLKCPGFSEHYVIEKQPGLLQTENCGHFSGENETQNGK